jgi:hypothetical protein
VEDFHIQEVLKAFSVPVNIYKLGELSRLAKLYPLLRDGLPLLEEVSTAAGKWHDTHES